MTDAEKIAALVEALDSLQTKAHAYVYELENGIAIGDEEDYEINFREASAKATALLAQIKE